VNISNERWTCRSKDGKKFAAHGDFHIAYDGELLVTTIPVRKTDGSVVALVINEGVDEAQLIRELTERATAIAALPELFDACERIISGWDATKGEVYGEDIKQLRSAIATAKGGAA